MITDQTLFLSLLILFFLLVSAFFSAVETAFTSLSEGQITTLEKKRGRRGRLVKHLSEHSDILLTTLLVGNNIANLACSAITTVLTINLLQDSYVAAFTGLLTLVILIFCEVSPKLLAIIFNESICLFSARIVQVTSILLYPIIFLVNRISRLVTRLITNKGKRPITLESLIHQISAAGHEGIVAPYEEQLVRNVFRINQTPVAAIMTHRTGLFSLLEDTNVSEAIELFIDSGHSRAPVVKNGEEQIIGVITLNDLLNIQKHSAELPIGPYTRKPYLVPATMKASELFTRLKTEPIHMAIVLDEYGGLDGLVTREDVMEEICGDLYNDDEKQSINPITSNPDGSWTIQGDANFNDVLDFLKIDLEHSSHTHTVGGYLMEKLQRIPEPGVVITLPEGQYTIQVTSKHRILSVTFIATPSPDE